MSACYLTDGVMKTNHFIRDTGMFIENIPVRDQTNSQCILGERILADFPQDNPAKKGYPQFHIHKKA